jgi:hypothetical protein
MADCASQVQVINKYTMPIIQLIFEIHHNPMYLYLFAYYSPISNSNHEPVKLTHHG